MKLKNLFLRKKLNKEKNKKIIPNKPNSPINSIKSE